MLTHTHTYVAVLSEGVKTWYNDIQYLSCTYIALGSGYVVHSHSCVCFAMVRTVFSVRESTIGQPVYMFGKKFLS